MYKSDHIVAFSSCIVLKFKLTYSSHVIIIMCIKKKSKKVLPTVIDADLVVLNSSQAIDGTESDGTIDRIRIRGIIRDDLAAGCFPQGHHSVVYGSVHFSQKWRRHLSRLNDRRILLYRLSAFTRSEHQRCRLFMSIPIAQWVTKEVSITHTCRVFRVLCTQTLDQRMFVARDEPHIPIDLYHLPNCQMFADLIKFNW